ncbi:dna-binding protein : : HTH_31 [Gemmata massiliana]|uniref:Dna-binding protein:: HTH_31 n=1 Tax=Gemmata massiliana TaxID=1210884 RepID=A0A6P2CPP3_9BACT|nr:helix-turn-helix domain-containing protein [Gemmata massiliana]VTR90799.1 dna-binding protein : : HTH_31 [Gemmata massiliana]
MGLSKNIAYRLQTLRAAAGLSQQQVADQADLSLSLITKMEQGRKADPRASTILALAGALGVKPGQLIEDLTPPPEGVFPPKKGKKGKKKKKLLAALVGVGAADTSLGATDSGDAPAAETLALASESAEKPVRKKKKKK